MVVLCLCMRETLVRGKELFEETKRLPWGGFSKARQLE